jgi:hypothetical protein
MLFRQIQSPSLRKAISAGPETKLPGGNENKTISQKQKAKISKVSAFSVQPSALFPSGTLVA